MKHQRLFFLVQFLCWLIFERLPMGLSWQSLAYLDLSSNLFEGPLPPSICNLTKLEILVLANNRFNGTIPKCLGNFSSGLLTLDLRNNGFHGTIPTHFSKDIQLKNLGLNGNNLEGPLPPSLKHCKNLEVLDVGKNKIRDTFPMWLASLPKLHVLILRSNRFYGNIGPSVSLFPKLRILDLSYNDFNGSLPAEFFKNLPAMMSTQGENEPKYMGEGGAGSYYLDSVTLVWKGTDVVMTRVLSILSTIDLSANKFEGKIPETMGNLYALKLLNLSYNSFSDSIPPVLGNLRELETLDLSCNQFKGTIPWKLGNIRSLAKLNLSQNQLVGHIPTGGQFNTFSEDSYYGNAGLCGGPLNNSCDPNERPQSLRTIFQETDFSCLLNGFTWKSVVLGYGFGIIIGLATGGLVFLTEKPKWILKILLLGTNKKRYRYIYNIYSSSTV